MNYGVYSGSGAPEILDGSICVYKSSGNTRYWVTATGSGSGGAFSVSYNGISIPFSVGWKASPGTSGNFSGLSANSGKRFTGVDMVSETCSGSYNAAIKTSFRSQDLAGQQRGIYTGSLSILIEPD